MKRFLKTTGLAAALMMGGAVSASAAILDFTDDGTPFVGTIVGANYSVTSTPPPPNNTEPFDGNPAEASPDLALERDGLGVIDDEVTNPDGPPVSEIITITFDRNVILKGIDFLDLFEAPNGGASEEVAIVTVDGVAIPLLFTAAFQEKSGDNPGYAFADAGSIIGKVFTFEAADTNDTFGEPDYALAALRLAPIPLPAGFVLLGTALAGLGVARRRKA